MAFVQNFDKTWHAKEGETLSLGRPASETVCGLKIIQTARTKEGTPAEGDAQCAHCAEPNEARRRAIGGATRR